MSSSPIRNDGGREARHHRLAVVEKLVVLGFAVAIRGGTGESANFSGESYRAARAGAEIVPDVISLWGSVDIV